MHGRTEIELNLVQFLLCCLQGCKEVVCMNLLPSCPYPFFSGHHLFPSVSIQTQPGINLSLQQPPEMIQQMWLLNIHIIIISLYM